jgi:hypothetical protein
MTPMTYYVALGFKRSEEEGGEIVSMRSKRGTKCRASDPNG